MPHRALSMIGLRLHRECTTSESQYGFQPESGTMDAVFILRTLMEAYREKRRVLHVAFLELQKAFDCVPRQCIWWVDMRAIGLNIGTLKTVTSGVA